MAWTAPRTWVAGEIVTAAIMNTHVRDNLSLLKTSIADDGRVQALSSTYFASLSAANLTSIPGSQLTGTVAASLLTGTYPTGMTVTGQGAASAATITAQAAACGTGGTSYGPMVIIGRNTSGTGGPGFIRFQSKNGTNYDLWHDNSGNLRTNGFPQAESDTDGSIGTVVGTQTSTLDTKDVLGDGVSPEDALAIILRTPIKRFRYKNGAYSGSVFDGIIADDSPTFAMDPNDRYPQGRSFNPVSAFGYVVQAIKALSRQMETQQTRRRRPARRRGRPTRRAKKVRKTVA